MIEIKEPALDSVLVAENIAGQLKKRSGHRRIMKMACENAMNAGALGVKVICGGRLSGAEIARSEVQKLGSIPLSTLDANVDYGTATARTTYGAIGIKVWIYKGKFGEEITPIMPRRGGGPKGGRGGNTGRPRSSQSRQGNTRAASPAAPAPAATSDQPATEKKE
ncbi:MAG: 30S ribosomal protein S3 [Planctomycetota bacterium]